MWFMLTSLAEEIKSVSAKAATSPVYFMEKLAILCTENSTYMQILKEMPLSAKAHRQPPSLQSYPWRGKGLNKY